MDGGGKSGLLRTTGWGLRGKAGRRTWHVGWSWCEMLPCPSAPSKRTFSSQLPPRELSPLNSLPSHPLSLLGLWDSLCTPRCLLLPTHLLDNQPSALSWSCPMPRWSALSKAEASSSLLHNGLKKALFYLVTFHSESKQGCRFNISSGNKKKHPCRPSYPIYPVCHYLVCADLELEWVEVWSL